ncbi:IS3 family transposase [Kineococcus sp. NBC_00420]|uniref:IS3 family transposase n=1 Tax=Kineococcus sp. NBC_00420 TaxID=2903564 RepID=UPI002E1D2307
MIFPLVHDLAGDGLPVAVTWRVLGVSRSGYHEWRDHPASDRLRADAALTQTIVEVHASSRATYGAPRVPAELRLGLDLDLDLGIACGRKRIARLMRAAGLVGVCHRRKRSGAKPLPAPHEDLVRRRFIAEEPNRLWVSDITEHPTSEGKVYCTAMVDVFSRCVQSDGGGLVRRRSHPR